MVWDENHLDQAGIKFGDNDKNQTESQLWQTMKLVKNFRN